MLALSGIGRRQPARGRRGRQEEKEEEKEEKGPSFALQALNMTGANEVPPNPGDPLASGTANFTVDPKKGRSARPSRSRPPRRIAPSRCTHIHQGGPTVNGPIVIDFRCCRNACLSDTGLLAELKANPGGFYANIHTNNFTGGAVRQQLAEGSEGLALGSIVHENGMSLEADDFHSSYPPFDSQLIAQLMAIGVAAGVATCVGVKSGTPMRSGA